MKKLTKTILFTAVISALASFSAFASDITGITVSLVENKSDPGVVYEAEVNAGGKTYELTDVEYSRPYEDWIAGSKVTITATLEPTEGNSFKNSAKVSVKGANTELISKTVTSRKAVVRFNYFPKMMLPEPENLYYEEDMYAKWDKIQSAQYEVRIYKEDDNANMKKFKTVKVTKPEIDLLDYITDGSMATFEVRAIAKNDKSAKYILASNWVGADDYTSSEYIGGTSEGYVNGSNGTYYYTGSDNKKKTGFQEVNGIWYYFNPNDNGKALTNQWAFIDNQWWYFNEAGMMQVGWINVNGLWYYMNTNHDGTYGAMMTGWIQLGEGGPMYYLNPDPNNGRVYGSMYANEMTPDGHYVDESGARVY